MLKELKCYKYEVRNLSFIKDLLSGAAVVSVARASSDAEGVFQHVLRRNAPSGIHMQYSLQQVHKVLHHLHLPATHRRKNCMKPTVFIVKDQVRFNIISSLSLSLSLSLCLTFCSRPFVFSIGQVIYSAELICKGDVLNNV